MKEICLSLHYNASDSFLYANCVKFYPFKAKNFEIKPYKLCLGNISKDLTVDNIKKTGMNGKLYNYPVSYDIIDASEIVDRYKCLMKKQDIV